MAIESDTQRMMLNWAAWRSGSISSVAMSGAYSLEGRGRREDVSIPLINGEAVEVDQAVCELDAVLKRVVEEYWTRTGTINDKARRSSCSVAALYRRLDRAHRSIRSYRTELRRRQAARYSLTLLNPITHARGKA